ncbi:MAG: thiamine ABC transporter substrate-binding protein [Microthrixaceae bacterium]
MRSPRGVRSRRPRDVRNLAAIPDRLRLDRGHRLFPVDVAPVCVDYDSKWFADHSLVPPATLSELTDARYRGLLVIERPDTSSPGLVFLAATHAALGAGTERFWRDLFANDVVVASGWDDAWNRHYTVSGGDRPLVVSYATSPPAEVVYSEGKVDRPRTKVVEATCAEQVEMAGVLAGTRQHSRAVRVLDAMLGARWQRSLPLSNFVYPARTDVSLPAVFTRFVRRPAEMIRLDPTVVNRERDRWLEDWRALAP